MNSISYYQYRINKVLNYINAHLSEEIKIKDLAQMSGFSPFHFARIYKALTNETPYDSILRLRLEKSIFFLKYHHRKSISTIAYSCGFPSPENFSRQFKSRFQISPNQFRKDKKIQNSRIYQEPNPHDFYLHIEEARLKTKPNFNVQIEMLPNISIAYIKAVFGADGSGLVEKYHELIEWAGKRDIKYGGELRRFGMSMDNIEATPSTKFRYDFAIKLEKEYDVSGNIEIGEIPKSAYATIHVIGQLGDVSQAWDFLYKAWLPESSYIPLDYPAIEEFIQGPEEIGWENFNIKCRIPIKKRIP